MELVGTVSGGGAKIEVYAEYNGSGTTFQIAVVEGHADLRGFFFDYLGEPVSIADLDGNGEHGQAKDSDGSILDHAVTDWWMGTSADGDDIAVFGSNENNMKGTGEAFDAGLLLGASGGMSDAGVNDDVQWITFTVDNLALDEIDGQSFGIRALSVGGSDDSRDGSVKLLGTFDVTDGGIES